VSTGSTKTKFQSLLNQYQLEFPIPAGVLSDLAARELRNKIDLDARVAPRFPCNGAVIVQCTRSAPPLGNLPPTHRAVVRNLSRTGLSFLSNRQFYPGQEVQLFLPTATATARIVRCRVMERGCFDVGVRFTGYQPA
jgi:hypothetical protein